MRDDWTPLPPPTDGQVEAAARSLLHIAELEPMRRGGVTFRRDNLALVSWWDPAMTFDWDCQLDEIAVLLSDPPLFIADDEVEEREFQREQNLARCRLAVRHAVERCDQSLTLMGDAIERQDDPE